MSISALLVNIDKYLNLAVPVEPEADMKVTVSPPLTFKGYPLARPYPLVAEKLQLPPLPDCTFRVTLKFAI
jgi:hypothetical protein